MHACRLAFMKGYGGVFVQASLRGGGEYGIDWRNAGSKENKQNVFDDFQVGLSTNKGHGVDLPRRVIYHVAAWARNKQNRLATIHTSR